MREASMKRMSPPTGVHARPVATPGTPVRVAISDSNFCGPSTATCAKFAQVQSAREKTSLVHLGE
jgi:hypothetical protein